MQVNSYVFQSPYPQQIQFGTPDPVAQAQQKAAEAVEQIPRITNETANRAEAYSGSSGALSVNVANATSNAGVSGSLAEFTSVNTQLQAAEAYSSS